MSYILFYQNIFLDFQVCFPPKLLRTSRVFFHFSGKVKKIYNLGIHNLLVECGSILTNNILKEKLFNEFYLFKSSKKLTRRGTINVKNINKNLNITFKKKKNINTYLDKDSLIHYY